MNNLEDLYREIILDHYRSPRNRGELTVPPAHRTEGFNPLCGDEVVLFIEVSDGKLSDIKVAGSGCSISQASASLMSAAVNGKPIDEVHRVVDSFKQLMTVREEHLDDDEEPQPVDLRAMGELAALQGVVKFPVRIKCATLSWNTLLEGLSEVGS